MDVPISVTWKCCAAVQSYAELKKSSKDFYMCVCNRLTSRFWSWALWKKESHLVSWWLSLIINQWIHWSGEFGPCGMCPFKPLQLLRHRSDHLDPCRESSPWPAALATSVWTPRCSPVLHRVSHSRSSGNFIHLKLHGSVSLLRQGAGSVPPCALLSLTNLNKFNIAAVLWLSHCNNLRNLGCPLWLRAA